MTHPTREDWMSYLYDELPANARSSLRTHLDSCAECRAQVQTWQSASRSLDEFTLPRRRKVLPRTSITKWAIAAAFVAFAALGVTRLAALNSEMKQLRVELQASLKRDVESAVRLQLAEKMQGDFDKALNRISEQAAKSANAEARTLIATVAQRIEAQRLVDQQTTLAALQKLSARHTEDYAALRKELETVAVLTEAGLQRAQSQIATLAYSPLPDGNNK
jgi:hypothetical protein